MQEGLLDWLQQLPLRVKPGPRGPRMPSSAIRGKAALQTEKTDTGDGREIEAAVEAVAERTARALLHPPGNTTRNSDIAPCGPCVGL